jgi:creatinine amidohydrolase
MMFLEKMRSSEVAQLPREQTIVVCGISAMEQHSLHLPMGTDFFIGSEIVRRLEAELPDRLLCLPVVWFGSSGHHMDFSGTISVSSHNMVLLLGDIARSMYAHGFRKLLFFNSHGGNRGLLARSVQELGEEIPDLSIVGTTYWELAKEQLTAIRESPFGGLGHACELETSIILKIDPALAQMDKARTDGLQPRSRFTRGEMLQPPIVSTYRTMKQMSAHGGVGDPTCATAEKGEKMLEAITTELRLLCEDFLSDRL